MSGVHKICFVGLLRFLLLLFRLRLKSGVQPTSVMTNAKGRKLSAAGARLALVTRSASLSSSLEPSSLTFPNLATTVEARDFYVFHNVLLQVGTGTLGACC